jgi:hypothetical protein
VEHAPVIDLNGPAIIQVVIGSLPPYTFDLAHDTRVNPNGLPLGKLNPNALFIDFALSSDFCSNNPLYFACQYSDKALHDLYDSASEGAKIPVRSCYSHRFKRINAC